MHQMRLLSASLVLAFGLAACGGSDSTSAPAVPVASASSGVLVDDLIAGATVFCDDNSNGVLDAGEKSAVTERFTADGATGGGGPSSEFAAYIAQQQKIWKEIVRRAGIKAD